MRELRRLVLLLLIALACLTQLALAMPTAGENFGKVGEVSCTVSYYWPTTLVAGYFPANVRVFNGEAGDVVVGISAEQVWGEEDVVTRRVALAAGETIEFELLLRARKQAYNQYKVTFKVGGDDCTIMGAGPSDFGGFDSGRVVLYATKSAVAAGADERWSEEWTASAASSSHHGGDGHVVASCTHDQLAKNWQAYTSIDALILDLSEGAPSKEALAAVFAWCRAGGMVLLSGANDEELAQLPEAESLYEERFLIESWKELTGDWSLDALLSRLAVYRCGFGVLIVQKSEAVARSLMEGTDGGSSLAMSIIDTAFAPTWTRDALGKRSRQSQILRELGNFSNLPLRSLMLLIIGFALLMGPVNFLWVKRKKNPMLLLISVPTIALVASVTLILYGVFSQGLDVKSLTRSWTILDQRIGWSTTAEVRRVFAGSAPGEGLRPEAGTLIYPEAAAWNGGFNRSRRFTMELDEGRLYGGDYFPIRQPFGQLILSDRAARLRLEARIKDGAVEVTNALGAPILDLLLRTPSGEFHYSRNALSVGKSSSLVAGGLAAKSAEWKRDLNRILGEDVDRLLPGTYIARLESGVLVDECGVRVREVDGRHLLLGILDASAGVWQ